MIDGAAMIGRDAAEKRAALDRLEQQAPNLANPFMDYPPVLAWLARHGRTAGTLSALERRTRERGDPVRLHAAVAGLQGLATNARFARALAVARPREYDRRWRN